LQSKDRCCGATAADILSATCMKHLLATNQVLSNESQVIPTIQVLTEMA
jgi:hypothetical protein